MLFKHVPYTSYYISYLDSYPDMLLLQVIHICYLYKLFRQAIEKYYSNMLLIQVIQPCYSDMLFIEVIQKSYSYNSFRQVIQTILCFQRFDFIHTGRPGQAPYLVIIIFWSFLKVLLQYQHLSI